LGVSISTTEDSVTACAQLTRFDSIDAKCLEENITNPDTIIACYKKNNLFQGRCPVFNDKLEFQYSDIPCFNGKTLFSSFMIFVETLQHYS
jgi:hypothetical protein